MADTKISALTDGVTVQATDRIPVARSPFASGDNKYVTGTELAAFVEANLTAAEVRALISPLPVANGGTGQTTEAEALGEMIQALTDDVSPDISADYIVTYDASADTGKKALIDNILPSTRTRLTGDETIHVRTDSVDLTSISTASPAVATKTSHGLSAGDPVVFSVATNRQTCTISLANPAVITKSNHGFDIGDAVVFRSMGALPANLDPRIINTVNGDLRNFAMKTFYIIATGFTTGVFQVAATPGGSAISTAAQSQSGTHTVERARHIEVGTCTFATTVVTCAGHGLVEGQRVVFSTTGTLPHDGVYGAESNTYWYVKAIDANTFGISATSGGSAVNVAGAATGTHRVHRYSPLLTGMIEGKVYYVLATGLTADAFTFSLTDGGAAIVTTGTQVGKVQYQTGNDNNDGSAATRASAMLTIQGAYEYVRDSLDMAGHIVTIEIHSGTYYSDGEGNLLNTQNGDTSTIVPGCGWSGGILKIHGQQNNKSKVHLKMGNSSGDTFAILSEPGSYIEIGFVEFDNPDFSAINCFGSGVFILLEDIAISGINLDDEGHFIVQNGSRIFGVSATYDIFWGCGTLASDNESGHIWNISSGGGDQPSSVFLQACTTNLFFDPYFTSHDSAEPGGIVSLSGGSKYTNSFGTYVGTYTGTQGDAHGFASRFDDRNGVVPGSAFAFSGEGELNITDDPHLGYATNIAWDALRVVNDSGLQSEDGSPRVIVADSSTDFMDEWNDVVKISCENVNFPALLIEGTSAGAFGPSLVLYHNSSTPGGSDQIGAIYFYCNDNLLANEEVCKIWSRLVTTTAGSEKAEMYLEAMTSGTRSIQLSCGAGITIGDTFLDMFEPGANNLGIKTAHGICDNNANEQLFFTTTASAVNYWNMTNSAANGVQRLAALGGDSNIAATIASKGTDPVNIEVNSTTEASFTASGMQMISAAVPAGGTTGMGLKMSSTANLGVFFGSGAPSLSAAKGSLYMRTDGSGTGDRMYVNTNGTTGWTNVVTAT